MIKLPSPFKNIILTIDSIKQCGIKEVYMDEVEFQNIVEMGSVGRLRAHLNIGLVDSVCDCFAKLSDNRGILIESKNTHGERHLETAIRQLQITLDLLGKKGEKVDYAVIADLKLDQNIYSYEFNKARPFQLKQIKYKLSNKNKFLGLRAKNSEVPVFAYKS